MKKFATLKYPKMCKLGNKNVQLCVTEVRIMVRK